MAKDIIIILEELRCIALKNTEAETEPYIWPALIRIDDNTIATPALLSISTPIQEHARVVIKGSMRAGESAPIPESVGFLRQRFEDNLDVRRLILVVALLEHDETPEKAMKAGFQAFSSELAAALAENLLALSTADEEEEKVIVDAIQKRVESRVRSATENGLSSFEKAKVVAGFLNLDDPQGSAFRQFRPKGPVIGPALVEGPVIEQENFEPGSFTLSFEATGKVLGLIDTLSRYEIQGQLQVRPVVVDRCQPQIDAVNAAKAVVDGIDSEIKSLQDELQQASPAEKPFLVSEIKRLRTEEMPVAVAALDEARRDLQACRVVRPGFLDPRDVAFDFGRGSVLEPAGNGHALAHGGDGSPLSAQSSGSRR